MSLPKRYNPSTREPELLAWWQEQGVYQFNPDAGDPLYAIDTPPPTVSGHLHLGHTYSYSQTDFMARFWRMNGYNVFYPMGFDDNGLPTERLVERTHGVTAPEIGREAFIDLCLAASEQAEKEYRDLWQRLGLSVDWRYSYRTIDENSRRISQWSFIDLHRRGLVYRQKAPAIWCPTCHTAIAQADVDDLERQSTFYTLAFHLQDGAVLPIATTRPELLPACVAIFIHPDDPRGAQLAGREATVPLFGRQVPILLDPAADPAKGTGIVMCCTFGDATDVAWWRTHDLPLVEAIDHEGRMTAAAGSYAGLPTQQARARIVAGLEEAGLLLRSEPVAQSVRVHERCDTPVEYRVSRQWFIRVLDHKEAFLEAGEQIAWHPPHMKSRYRQWVENLAWDWCISRQRYFGVPFPVWYCDGCGKPWLATEEMLPVDPRDESPPEPCPHCGGESFTPEEDLMDTWATSSMTPQIVGQMFARPDLYERVFPFALRPQAHDIIRTWTFYTIVKSHYHFGSIPWQTAALSGWGVTAPGAGKISKSRGGGPMAPQEIIDRYSADAVRYWAASTGLGKDSVIDEQKIEAGNRLATKLWNVARFAERFLEGYNPPPVPPAGLTLADRWLLSRLQRLVSRATERFRDFDYASARSETEQFFWQMADNYLEMAKQRLYAGGQEAEGARYTLYQALHTLLHLLAPLLPYVTEAIYQGLWTTDRSIHRNAWPRPDAALLDERAESHGELLLEIAGAVRRYKSEAGLSLSTTLPRLYLHSADAALLESLREGEPDLASVTRAQSVVSGGAPEPGLTTVLDNGSLTVALLPADEASPVES
ncbi:MAG: valine--tRNA ligase [Chloroflexi bacterium]|nr:valine--tRNA ligase [Chloroflexota bacterium]